MIDSTSSERRHPILNVGKLRKGSELYYLNSVARGVEDYYTGAGEAPGYWLASGSRELGLEGTVAEDQLRAVLNGFDPASGARLMNGKLTKRQRVPGFDLTFRVPKSVSVLHALGDKEASNEVASAHDAAVAAALAYLERQASGARRGKGGKIRIGSHGFIAAAFRHRTSRAGDPLLHTHVLVANLVKGQDGRWGALDARQLYLQAKTAGYLYQAQLRYELSRRLGVHWGPVRSGAADLEGIPRSVIRAFSTRRAEIEAGVGEAHVGDAQAAELAAVTTRKAKDYNVTPDKLLPEWRERARKLGLTDDDLENVVGRSIYRRTTAVRRRAIADELAASSGLTAQSSTFTRRDALQGFCSRLDQGATIQEIEAMTDDFLSSSQVLALSAKEQTLTAKECLRVTDGRLIPAGAEELRYSTTEMLAVERDVIARATEPERQARGVARRQALDAALMRRPSLFDDQREMVHRLTTSGAAVDVVVGKAGAGKTFALDAAREAWESSGLRVIGCSLAARAAEELELGSGIRSYTIRRLLRDLDDSRNGGLPQGSVLVVDEAAMVGTRDLARLMTHAHAADAKVVLVGDDRQLPSIDAGGAFCAIKDRISSIELNEVRRQPDGWEREALDLVRHGHAQHAIDAYVAHGRVVMSTSAEDTRKRLIGDWWASRDDNEPAVMLAARRSDVSDLNARARSVMGAAGRLGDVDFDIAGASFAVGDRVMTLKNSRNLGVKNGNRGTVAAVDVERAEIVFRRDDGAHFVLPKSYLESGHLTHGYAMTGHKSQGMTTEKAFVLADQTLYREWAYVAMSRGRSDNRLYVVAGADPERDDVGGEVAVSDDPLKEVIAAVGRSRAKELALEYLDDDAASLDREPDIEDGYRAGRELSLEVGGP